MKFDKFYFINLDRRPNRNEHFLQECKKANIPDSLIHRFSAIDGTSYQFTRDEVKLFDLKNVLRHWNCKRLMGNQLSHHYIMKDIIKNQYKYTIVFQDDAIFKENFLEFLEKIEIPDDAEIINIGFHKVACLAHFIGWDLKSTIEDDLKILCKKRVNDHVVYLNDTTNPCSLAYIITLQGAQNMVKEFESRGFRDATDHNLNDYLKSKNIFYGVVPVLVTGDHTLPSDIFIP
jgi:GR25 family glycosyltransferase involved in LPS biosynthesis